MKSNSKLVRCSLNKFFLSSDENETQIAFVFFASQIVRSQPWHGPTITPTLTLPVTLNLIKTEFSDQTGGRANINYD